MVKDAPPGGNIFLTTENLAFALPLLLLCGSHAYFKYIPLQYGIPVLVFVVGLFYMRSQMEARRAEKLQNLDEDMINDIIGEEEEDSGKKAAAKKQGKTKAQLERRLAAERKKNEKASKKNANKKKAGGEDDDDDDDFLTFAKGSREKQKKR